MYNVDKKFPEFSLEVYHPGKDTTGTVTTRSLRGKFFVLFFYPADFTFVCPTELADMQKHYDEFIKAGAEVVSVSTDTVFTHKAWIGTEQLLTGIRYPMAADHNGKFSRELGIYDEEKGIAQRAAFTVDPEGILRAVDIAADSIGRSAGEILRKIKALQFVRIHVGKVCPASWEEGATVLTPSIKSAGKVYEQIAPFSPKRKKEK